MAGAAMVLARTALDLMEQPQLVDSARADMERAKGGAEYQTLIPTDVKAGSF